jgi:2-polyprenyl-3-methyl-5-hydroxy-6-metoxy-1,4-benzoquinol methylase
MVGMQRSLVLRLSKKEDWQYHDFRVSLDDVNDFSITNEWVKQVRKMLPHGEASYLELGCCPGICSAALAQGTKWSVSGVDYCDDGAIFTNVLNLIGKPSVFYQADIFEFKACELYEIVASYGLVEHFNGDLLNRVLTIHDECLKPGGYLVIEIPNFTGFQYFWHYLFDRPNLEIHNVDMMQPKKIEEYFQSMGYEILFSDYFGQLRVWGNSRFGAIGRIPVKLFEILINNLASFLSFIGIHLGGQAFSPTILLCAKKPL